MNRKGLVASFGFVAGLTAITSAQAPAPPSNGQVDQKAVQSVRVKVIGCVAGDTETGRYVPRAPLSPATIPGRPLEHQERWAPERTSRSRIVFRTTSSEAVSRHILAMKSKSSASPATRN